MTRFSLPVLFCLLLALNTNCLAMDLDYIRSHYNQAPSDKKLCNAMIAALNKNRESNVHLAYLGALQTIWANHVFNPFSKLSTFNQGKANIERAFSNETDNIEIRFIRLSVQKNCPRFLGYSKDIKDDELFLKENKRKISSDRLLKMVENLLTT